MAHTIINHERTYNNSVICEISSQNELRDFNL